MSQPPVGPQLKRPDAPNEEVHIPGMPPGMPKPTVANPLIRTLNRVPRACNACRKQKMRCEGAENPPCRRCRNVGIDCLFEKPQREPSLSGEAGLERIRSLEANVMDIRNGQGLILNTLAELQTFLRIPPMHQRPPPPEFVQAYLQGPPGSAGSPPTSHMPPPGMFPPGYMPPFSGLATMGPPPPAGEAPGNPNSFRPQPSEGEPYSLLAKRPAPNDDDEPDDNGGLPAPGLVAPWEVLRGLADVAIERAAKENGDGTDSDGRETDDRPNKRRKVKHKSGRVVTFPDVVSKNVITDSEARDLFKIYYHGCSTFLPVFDSKIDSFDALHERSPFAVDAICMVAARCRDGGGRPSEIHLKCLEEVQATSCASLFLPISKIEAVQAMLLVAGWSDNGWLSCGHAVRMAQELSLHKSWPTLMERIVTSQANLIADRELMVASRTWFALYLFEHQLSYATGRPSILKDDASIKNCRLILQHPATVDDDMRLVSTVELMALRERLYDGVPVDGPVTDEVHDLTLRAQVSFTDWFNAWDTIYSKKYEESAFYRQSLKVQQLHAELYHNALALRAIETAEDVNMMPDHQRVLALRSMQIARLCLDVTIKSGSYSEGLKYAVHYTHATATFTASLLLRLARLFPTECDTDAVRQQVERLVELMAEVPGKRYVLTLQVMLKHFRPTISGAEQPVMYPGLQDGSAMMPYPTQYQLQPGEVDQIWRGITTAGPLPVWASDQSLGGATFAKDGLNAFLLPNTYLPPLPQIW
ncbi:hypothetical protein CYLTODRAFT_383348 [Cylindrobasidium torrendii FP15055 ss-10]|uniref:Zn(2)-C6 fungal-type domain-containing protein n=1 Tax=Cylindrobasidium torrendii FP15055 ss-10 TaxID=1314674 RepID=A0A0D7AZB5_9AGAR|nr:hypothetical protein CYLTODRAFT_383348 [Cylindrobasidium torrendii FP15055 ss-10]